ncbi:unnamed protein product, partial [Brenthis ino]
MPMWCPPTPPSSDGDVYCEAWARPLYRRGAAADALLPPVRWRDARAPRSPRRARPAPRAAHAPPSLFERAGPRPRPRPRAPPPPARDPPAPPPDWAPCEDAALRHALRLQRLPPEPPAAHAPNWDWLADLVNETARAYRSPRACRDRHDALADPERAPTPRRAPKRRLDDAAHHNPKHAALLADHGVDYDAPPTPMEVATRRAERIAKEKLKAGAGAGAGASVGAGTGAAPAQAGPAPRVVVAAAAGKAEVARRRAAGEGARAAAPQAAQLLYRHQSLTTRHHLKILHHAPSPQPQAIGGAASVSVSAGASVEGSAVMAGGAALRTLQLQQLRRAAGRAPPPHVVLAHLAPSAHHAAPTPPAPPAVAAPQQHHTTPQPDTQQ